MLLKAVYTILIRLYGLLILLVSPFNTKAKNWVNGRKNWRQKLVDSLTGIDSEIIWIHCSSLGEFEQGLPLIQGLKTKYPETHFLVSFFSPSGFLNAKPIDKVTYTYLPLDTTANAKAFLNLVKPSLIFFVKYEFWPNILGEIHNRKVPCYLVSAIFRPQHYMFKSTGYWMKKQLHNFDKIFCQDQASADILLKHQINQVLVTGDTRFDRVAALLAENKQVVPAGWLENKKLLVLGSSWPQDEKLIASFKWENWKILIAPHEISNVRLKQIETLFDNNTARFSSLTAGGFKSKVLILDKIGILKFAYRDATLCWIGGGFGAGIHNTLEAGIYGKPILFGPNYSKFIEAVALIEQNAAVSIQNKQEFSLFIDSFTVDAGKLARMGENAQKVTSKYCGASEKIISSLDF